MYRSFAEHSLHHHSPSTCYAFRWRMCFTVMALFAFFFFLKNEMLHGKSDVYLSFSDYFGWCLVASCLYRVTPNFLLFSEKWNISKMKEIHKSLSCHFENKIWWNCVGTELVIEYIFDDYLSLSHTSPQSFRWYSVEFVIKCITFSFVFWTLAVHSTPPIWFFWFVFSIKVNLWLHFELQRGSMLGAFP